MAHDLTSCYMQDSDWHDGGDVALRHRPVAALMQHIKFSYNSTRKR